MLLVELKNAYLYAKPTFVFWNGLPHKSIFMFIFVFCCSFLYYFNETIWMRYTELSIHYLKSSTRYLLCTKYRHIGTYLNNHLSKTHIKIHKKRLNSFTETNNLTREIYRYSNNLGFKFCGQRLCLWNVNFVDVFDYNNSNNLLDCQHFRLRIEKAESPINLLPQIFNKKKYIDSLDVSAITFPWTMSL